MVDMGLSQGSALDTKVANVGLMTAERGYEVTIVCTSDAQQAAFWQQRLEGAKGTVVPAASAVVAVDEDWPGGAGNFLGTLYAWRKACAKHKELTGRDLAEELRNGASIALFHTAGKGTRMAPLPGGENNNKPGVRLPAPGAPSILESVIRQTGAYAQSRKSRLSVFWGDQVFVPSVGAEYTPQHHADIMCGLGPMPSAEEWAAKSMDKYGLIAADSGANVLMQLEKVTHEQATAQLAGKEGFDRVGTSLGSFSLSAALLTALDSEFAPELGSKAGKMDSDPHLWMAMTLAEESYMRLMIQKKLFGEEDANAHHRRVTSFLEKFEASEAAKASGLTGRFGAVNVGTEQSWWDYGLLQLYVQNALLLTKDTEDAMLARLFFGVAEAPRQPTDSSMGECQVDPLSVVTNSRVASGSVAGSCVAHVCAKELRAEGAVLMNVCARKIVAGKGAVAYNVVDSSEEGLVLAENEVRVGVFTLDQAQPYVEMKSNVVEIDGGKVFKDKVCGNKYSFQEVYDHNHGVDVIACAAKATAAFDKLSSELGLYVEHIN